MGTRWNPDAPADQQSIDCITRLLADRVLTGKYKGHTVCPLPMTALQANRAISDLQAMAYPDDYCRGGKCGPFDRCSRHSAEYQNKWGRAWNE